MELNTYISRWLEDINTFDRQQCISSQEALNGLNITIFMEKNICVLSNNPNRLAQFGDEDIFIQLSPLVISSLSTELQQQLSTLYRLKLDNDKDESVNGIFCVGKLLCNPDAVSFIHAFEQPSSRGGGSMCLVEFYLLDNVIRTKVGVDTILKPRHATNTTNDQSAFRCQVGHKLLCSLDEASVRTVKPTVEPTHTIFGLYHVVKVEYNVDGQGSRDVTGDDKAIAVRQCGEGYSHNCKSSHNYNDKNPMMPELALVDLVPVAVGKRMLDNIGRDIDYPDNKPNSGTPYNSNSSYNSHTNKSCVIPEAGDVAAGMTIRSIKPAEVALIQIDHFQDYILPYPARLLLSILQQPPQLSQYCQAAQDPLHCETGVIQQMQERLLHMVASLNQSLPVIIEQILLYQLGTEKSTFSAPHTSPSNLDCYAAMDSTGTSGLQSEQAIVSSLVDKTVSKYIAFREVLYWLLLFMHIQRTKVVSEHSNSNQRIDSSKDHMDEVINLEVDSPAPAARPNQSRIQKDAAIAGNAIRELLHSVSRAMMPVGKGGTSSSSSSSSSSSLSSSDNCVDFLGVLMQVQLTVHTLTMRQWCSQMLALQQCLQLIQQLQHEWHIIQDEQCVANSGIKENPFAHMYEVLQRHFTLAVTAGGEKWLKFQQVSSLDILRSQEWTSHSPYLRDRRISHGVVGFITKLRQFIWDLYLYCDSRPFLPDIGGDSSSCTHVAIAGWVSQLSMQMLLNTALLLGCTYQHLYDIQKPSATSSSGESPPMDTTTVSKTRLRQWKWDQCYMVYAVLDTLAWVLRRERHHCRSEKKDLTLEGLINLSAFANHKEILSEIVQLLSYYVLVLYLVTADFECVDEVIKTAEHLLAVSDRGTNNTSNHPSTTNGEPIGTDDVWRRLILLLDALQCGTMLKQWFEDSAEARLQTSPFALTDDIIGLTAMRECNSYDDSSCLENLNSDGDPRGRHVNGEAPTVFGLVSSGLVSIKDHASAVMIIDNILLCNNNTASASGSTGQVNGNCLTEMWQMHKPEDYMGDGRDQQANTREESNTSLRGDGEGGVERNQTFGDDATHIQATTNTVSSQARALCKAMLSRRYEVNPSVYPPPPPPLTSEQQQNIQQAGTGPVDLSATHTPAQQAEAIAILKINAFLSQL